MLTRLPQGVMVAALCISTIACFGTQKAGSPDTLEPAVKAKDPLAQQSFDDALAKLTSGSWAQAREAFSLLQSEHTDDPIAEAAELYVARARLGDLSLTQKGRLRATTTPADLKAAVRSLTALGGDAGVDPRVRFTARLYLALAQTAAGRSGDGLKALEGYPGPSLSPLVLSRDRALAWMLLTESFARTERAQDALISAGSLHEAARERADTAGISEAQAQVAETLMTFARARGMDAAGQIPTPTLNVTYLPSERVFLRAMAGSVVLQRLIDDPGARGGRAALESLYARTEGALVKIGALATASELSTLMAATAGEDRLILGAVFPLTGKNKAVGERAMRGVLLANQAFERGPEPRLTIVYRDAAQGDPKTIMADLKKLGVLGVIGPLDKERARSFGAAATLAGVPLLTLSTQALDATMPAGSVFRNFVSVRSEAQAAARHAYTRLGDRKVVILEPKIGYGSLMANTFQATFEQLGGKVVARKTYARDARDHSALARSVASLKPDAIFLPDTGAKVAQVTAFLSRENIWGLAAGKTRPTSSKRVLVHYLGTSLWQDRTLLTQAARYVQGAAIPTWFSTASKDPATELFVSRYRAVYGQPPSLYEAFAYDATSWLRAITVEQGMRRAPSVLQALTRPEGLTGVTGKVRFLSWGEAERTVQFVTVQGSDFVSTPYAETITPKKAAP